MMVLVVMCPEGNDGPDRLRSDKLENRIVGFLNRVRKAGWVLCNCTIRTRSTCLGRWRLIVDFKKPVTWSVISRDNTRQNTNERALNPPYKTELTRLTTKRRF